MANSLTSRTVAGSELFIVFFRELMISSLAVARAAFARNPATRSAIVAVPVTLKTDLGITTLANMITLTPGTCSLHVSCLLYTSPSPRDKRQSRMPSSA